MANVKISALTAATSVGSSDTLVIVQSGTTKKVAASVDFSWGGAHTFAGALTVTNNFNVTITASADRAVVATGGVSGSSGHGTLDVTGGYLRLSAGTNDIMWGTSDVAAGGGATATLTTIGGSGPGTAGQTAWLRVRNSSGTAYFIPVWQ